MFIIPRRFAGIKRFEEILLTISKHELNYFLEKVKLKKPHFATGKKISRPVEVRILFEELDGMFLKLGQLLSLRPDLIPKEYCEELSKLQDNIEPFSYAEVKHIVKYELKKPTNKAFKSFNKEPLAAASIGQVHQAKLKNGKKVVVKVMRPGIKSQVQIDLEIMEYLARKIKQHIKTSFDPELIFQEFKRYTEQELDYLQEAHNIKKFCEKNKDLMIPKVIDNLTTHRLLTMTYVEGTELKEIIHQPVKNKAAISEKLVTTLFKQIFVDGLFHADPHPGNILIKGNKIGLLDFGIVGRIKDKEKLLLLFASLISRNAEAIVHSMINMGIVNENISINELEEDLSDSLGEYYDVEVEKVDMPSLFFKMIEITKKHNVQVPREFVLLGKSMVTIQGVCLQLNPHFNLVRTSKPFIKKLVNKKGNTSYLMDKMISESKRLTGFVYNLPTHAKRLSGSLEKADLTLASIDSKMQGLTREIRYETFRLILGILIAALIVGASIIKGETGNLMIIMAIVILAYLVISFNFRKVVVS